MDKIHGPNIISKILALFLLSLFLVPIPTSLFATELADEGKRPPATQTKKEIQPVVSLQEQVDTKAQQETPFLISNESIAPGSLKQINWPVTLSGIQVNIPIIVAHGKYKGPVICLTAALHGDELNGIEISRQVMYGVNMEQLAGTLVAVPIVNIDGFLKQSRYIADRRDLNRYFPGDPKGVTPARYAYALFQNVILKCDALIDLHTGSYYRLNLPQLRADMTNDAVVEMVEKFRGLTVLHSPGVDGMLRNAASAAGIPAVTMEVGGPLSVDPEDIAFGVKAINTFLADLGMIRRVRLFGNPQPVFYQSQWLLADFSGILLVDVKLGDNVKEGQNLATIVNPMTNEEQSIIAPFIGTILGMAQNQFVNPGYMIFRIGIRKTEEELRQEAQKEKETEEKTMSTNIDIIIDSEQETQEIKPH